MLGRIERSDSNAAGDLLRRYSRRLVELGRSRISRRLAPRVDPDDVLQSTYRSFFQSAERGGFRLSRPGDLWRLLATIALRKVYRQARRNRDVLRSGGGESLEREVPSREPSAHEIAAAADEVEHLLRGLDEESRRILVMKLAGESTAEIGRALAISERTIRRRMETLRRRITAPSAPQLRESNLLDYRDFLLTKYVGAGRVGRVYRALQRSDGRTVAVKFLRKEFQRDRVAVSRFFEEMEVVQRLADPGVAAIHGRGRTRNGGCFLVMEFFPDGDLHRHASTRRPSTAAVVRWARTLAETLARVHSDGIVHCDVKPSNIMLDGRQQAVLTDFGLSTRIGAPRTGVEGTAPFLAPEQVSSRWGEIGPTTDVYGLGATLYWLIAGTPPWNGDTVDEILAKVESEEEARPLSDVVVLADAKLAAICDRCLKKAPGDRYPSCAEVARELRDVEDRLVVS